jgi:prophage antirepressor-like protein
MKSNKKSTSNQKASGEKMPEVFTFDHNHKPVRVEMIDGEPWFVAKDVCDILGLTNPTEALRNLDDDEKNTLRLSEGIQGRGNPNVNVVNESGLYALIIRSNKPEARAFRKWVTSVLLPVVCKTGKYAPGIVENDCPYTQPDILPSWPPAVCLATPEWLLDLMNDVCRIEDTGLRVGMSAKLMSVKRI